LPNRKNICTLGEALYICTMQNEQNNKLTDLEIKVLHMVSRSQIEDGFSEYDSVSSASEKGILGSLVKKGLVYDARELEPGDDYMYCLTDEGFVACSELGISTSHIIMFN
jgi:replication-associated recombination protein RarA